MGAEQVAVHRRIAAVVLVLGTAVLGSTGAASAGPLAPREGWEIARSGKPWAALLESLEAAVEEAGMAVVTQAGPTEAARARGVTIPGNRVVGVFRNDFVVRVLELSTAAMIEAPIRFHVSEGPDGVGWLSYKHPSFVFAPYAAEGGARLAAIGAELDAIFARIAARALAP